MKADSIDVTIKLAIPTTIRTDVPAAVGTLMAQFGSSCTTNISETDTGDGKIGVTLKLDDPSEEMFGGIRNQIRSILQDIELREDEAGGQERIPFDETGGEKSMDEATDEETGEDYPEQPPAKELAPAADELPSGDDEAADLSEEEEEG